VRAVSAIRMHMLWRYGKEHKDALHLDEAFFGFLEDTKLPVHSNYVRNVQAWRRHYPDLVVLNYEDFHTDREGSVKHVFDLLNLDMGEIQGPMQERMNRLMKGRVWASEKFPVNRAVLMFLHGLTWPYRKATEDALGMSFAEGERMLRE
jgi:hypothetical protein